MNVIRMRGRGQEKFNKTTITTTKKESNNSCCYGSDYSYIGAYCVVACCDDVAAASAMSMPVASLPI